MCNGCQLMALLGWVPGTNETYTPFLPDEQQPRFIHNRSGRFESRWLTVTIRESPAIMLKVPSQTKDPQPDPLGLGMTHCADAACPPRDLLPLP